MCRIPNQPRSVPDAVHHSLEGPIMARKTVFPGAASKMDALIAHLEEAYRARQFEVQVLEIEDQEVRGKLLQMKEATPKTWLDSAWNIAGLGTTTSVKVIAHGPALEVEVFGGKWLDKVAVGAVSLVVLWPLLITAGVGAWKQNALLDEVYRTVSTFLSGPADAPPHTAAAPTPTHCAQCGDPVTSSMRFCGGCGAKVGS